MADKLCAHMVVRGLPNQSWVPAEQSRAVQCGVAEGIEAWEGAWDAPQRPALGTDLGSWKSCVPLLMGRDCLV